VVVVDPGVGSPRRAIAAEAGDWRFVAPDNGVLTGVFQETPPKTVVELTERRYARPTVSRTFEGRDRFAPAAAWLSKGIQLSAFGRALTDYHTLSLPRPSLDGPILRGVVVRIDRFGNVVTNLDRRSCEKLTDGSGAITLTVGGRTISRIVSTFAEIGSDDIGALFGSTDHLECAASSASAADRLGVAVGDTVELRRS
jgi:S-adenosyl-L-methionine hydrolase (adenosine-forming)